jgi:exosortase
LSAVGALAPARPRSRADRVTVSFGAAFALATVATGVAFAHAYAGLSPLVGSESPESLLLVVPFAAAVVLWRRLAEAGRDGAELTVNLFLGTPLLLVLLTTLLWFPSRLSYFYWVYRLDLLAVPFFVAFVVLVLFGLTALWRARWAIVLLLFGWPPLLDTLLGIVTARICAVQAALLGLLPLPGTRVGSTFLLGPHEAITVAAPCSGLLGVVSMLLVGGVILGFRTASRRRKLAWLATAVALALAANVLRLALVVAVAGQSGIDSGFAVFHALAGPVLFSLTLLVALQLLAPFGLTPAGRPRQRRPLELPRATATAIATTIAGIAVLALWATTAGGSPGLFRDAIVLDRQQLLPLPVDYSNTGTSQLASLGSLFGAGAQAQLTHIASLHGDAVAAQVVVTPSYREARRYDVLDCFVFHHEHIYSTHVEPLVGGGSSILIAVRLDRRDVATLTWIQPAVVDGKHVWRRVLLFAYLDGARSRSLTRVASAQAFGTWLLDRFGPYGATSPPVRFRQVERGLVALADRLVAPTGAGPV